MEVRVGTFTAPASTTGNQVVTVPGAAMTPTALLIWTTYQDAAGYTDAAYFGIGFTNGTTQIWAAGATDDNTSPNDTNRTLSVTQICRIENIASTNIRIGSFVSFGLNAFTINWTTADAFAPIFHYVVLDCVAEIAIAANGDYPAVQSPTLSTFPQAVVIVAANTDGDAFNQPAIGWAATDAESLPNGQGACAINVEDGQTTQDVWRYQEADQCAAILTSANGVIYYELLWVVTGLGCSNPSVAAAVPIHMLGLSGISAKAGSLNQPTSTGTQAISGLGFTPKVVFLMSVGNTTSVGTQTQMRQSFGAGDGTSMGRSWIGSEDAVNPSQAAKGHSTAVVLSAVATVDATGSSNVAAAECTLQSLDADGFTLNWTVADATAREVLWLALGDGTPTPSGSGTYAVGHIG